MAEELKGMRVAFVAAPAFERVELTEPWKAIVEAGGGPELISIQEGEIYSMDHHDKSQTFKVDHTIDQADPNDYDALMLPGGVSNPDQLRMNQDAVAFIRSFFDAGKPVAVICHGPWTLIEADVVRGRTLTSWPSVQTDIRNAGGTWVDEEVHVEDGLVSSRKPDDLPAFCRAMVEAFSQARSQQRRSA